jgi:hypothetical protein
MGRNWNRRTAGKTKMPELDLTELTVPAARTSPLVLSDRMIRLAQDADRAGLTVTARQLVRLACKVLEEPAAKAN